MAPASLSELRATRQRAHRAIESMEAERLRSIEIRAMIEHDRRERAVADQERQARRHLSLELVGR